MARDVGSNPGEGVAVGRVTNRSYITSGASPGLVTVLQDTIDLCLEPFSTGTDTFGYDLFVAE